MKIKECLFFVCVLGISHVPAERTVSSKVKDLASANAKFAMNIYDELRDLANDGNIFFSPLSISLALGMTYAGAKENTKNQMAQVMEFDEAADSDDALNEAFQELIDTFNNPDKNYTLNIANRLFGSKNYQFLTDYLRITEEYYRAALEEMDFVRDSEGSTIYINNWVANQTNQKIKDLIPKGAINSMTALVLVNAIYFKGLWNLPFDAEDTESRTFHAIDGQNVEMDMMHIEGDFQYGEVASLDSQVLELPYQGGDVAMGIILPKDRQGLESLEEKLDGSDLNQIMSELVSQNVRVSIPKFKLTQDISLKAILSGMGMEDLFNGGVADLSGMSGQKDLYVTEVVHKAYVDVNEEGTEAAGATGVIVGLTSVREVPMFTADHPFLFFIREKPSGSILFLGRLTKSPSETAAVGAFGRGSDVDTAASVVPSWIALVFALMLTVMRHQ